MSQPEPEEALNNNAEPEIAETADAETLLAVEKAKAEGYLANWQRAQADFINYKRRIEQERQDFSKFANSTLILSILPILDDLERAFDSIPPELAGLDWVDGIRLIGRKLRANLEAQGLTRIKSLGEPFDPRLHEAVRQVKGEEGIVIDELQKGYMLNDRLLRPSKVIVGNGEEAKKEE